MRSSRRMVLLLLLLGALSMQGGAWAADKDANTKKPGESCEKLARGTDAYKDCVAKAAHTGQTAKSAGTLKDADKGKKAVK